MRSLPTLMVLLLFAGCQQTPSHWNDGPFGPWDDGAPDGDASVTPPSRPVDPADPHAGEDDPIDPPDPTPAEPDPDVDPDRALVPPGGYCACDSDCQPTGGHDPICIHGICGVRSTDDRCPSGSAASCPDGHRCWSGTGMGVCYPDFVAGQCAGQRDSDGSCVTDGDRDCYAACGALCDLDGAPPTPVPDDDGGDTPPDGDPCEGLDYLGTCDGDVARWCSDGRLQQEDCRLRGQTCGYVNDRIGYYCQDDGGDDPVDPDSSEPGEACSDTVVIEVVNLVNQARRSSGLAELRCDEGLTRAAYLHSRDMCDRGYISHTSRDGRSHSDRIRAQGVSFSTSGENIAWGQSTPAEVHRTWMNSWGHRANILGRQYGRIGVGYDPCGGRPLWTQNFTD